jgi:hypothetical protein
MNCKTLQEAFDEYVRFDTWIEILLTETGH